MSVRLPDADPHASADDPRSWESWCEPWLGEEDGVRVVRVPLGELDDVALMLSGRQVERRDGFWIWRWQRSRVVEEVLELLSTPGRYSERHAALLQRLCSQAEWEQARLGVEAKRRSDREHGEGLARLARGFRRQH